MKLTKYDRLPSKLQNQSVLRYYNILEKKTLTLFLKRAIDLVLCSIAIIITSPFLLLFAVLIKLTSKGEVLFKQKRVGRDLKPFYIFKFRTMVKDADKQSVQLTTGDDARITPFGKFLRKINMDEMPQLFNVLRGEMSIIGTRPEVEQYVDGYTDDMLATLLVAPGMLSLASIKYKNENDLLTGAADPQKVYIEQILPDKMKYNLQYLENLSIGQDFKLMGMSISAAFKS